MFEDRQRDGRLIERQRLHDRGGRLRAAREHLGHRLAHQRRWIVEKHQQRAFGGRAILPERSETSHARASARVASARTPAEAVPNPTDELPNDHVPAGLRNLDVRGGSATLQLKINPRRLISVQHN